MSLRILYRKVPASQRICSYYQCLKPILRNIDRDNQGHLYHHGCLLSAREERYRCLECYLQFDATEVAFEAETKIQREGFMRETMRTHCPSCGCMNLKRIRSN